MREETPKQKADRINAQRRKQREEKERQAQPKKEMPSSISAQQYSDRILQTAVITSVVSSIMDDDSGIGMFS